MELFRRKQKLIFWVVTIIIVPSFVLVWGVGGLFDRAGGRDDNVEIGTVNGRGWSYLEFEAFRKRLSAAVGGMPIQFAGAPGGGSRVEELWKYSFAYSLLQDADNAGSRATDVQIGTYLQAQHPVVASSANAADPKSVERAVDAFCRQMQMSRAEFLRGVREWQTIGNYIISDANLAVVNDDTIFTYYAVNNSECVVKRVRVSPTEAMREQAKSEVMEKPGEELEKDVAAYIASKAGDRRYRNPAVWRFAYVMLPAEPESADRFAPDPERLEAYYQANRDRLFAGKPFEDVRERIQADLAREETERQAHRNFEYDVDPQLRAHPDISLEDLARLTPLAKHGVKTGTSGDEPLPAGNLADTLPSGVDATLFMTLDLLDAAPEKRREELIEGWKKGFSLPGVLPEPLKVDNGFIRLRLLDYTPSSPASPVNPDGGVNPSFYETAVSDMVADRVGELVREKAVATETDIRLLLEARKAGAVPPDAAVAAEFDALPIQVLSYLEIPDADYALGRLVVGEMSGPNPGRNPVTGETDQELVVMLDRRTPPRSAFDNEPDDLKARYRAMSRANYQGSFGFTYTESGPAAVIQPSPAIMANLAGRYNRGEITVRQELFAAEGEG